MCDESPISSSSVNAPVCAVTRGPGCYLDAVDLAWSEMAAHLASDETAPLTLRCAS